MKYDPYNHKKRFEDFEARNNIEGLSLKNSKIIIDYLDDMKSGMNTARKKPLSYIRLNSVKQRMIWTLKKMEELYMLRDITKIKEKQALDFFNVQMRQGKIKQRNGKAYLSIDTYVNTFKSFWHWHMRRENSNDNNIKDITTYLDTSQVKESTFVYFKFDDLKKVANRAKFEYKVLMWFLFDSGIRAPTELMNIKVNDLLEIENSRNYQLNIRDEVSKTFGRRIKLLVCSELLREYIRDNELKDNDFLFTVTPKKVNQYLKRLFNRVLGTYKTKGGKHINEIGMYDFRHSSSCYWLPRYKSESALKYRFGWKKDTMIHHYSKLLGMKDTIEEQDLMLDSEIKTKIERELEGEKQQREILQEKIQAIENQNDENTTFIKKYDTLLFSLLNKFPKEQLKKAISDKNIMNDFIELKNEKR